MRVNYIVIINIMKKYTHNAVSVDSPEHFRGNFSVIHEKPMISLGKKFINYQESIPM